MKLSEAILLGSTILRPSAGHVNDGKGTGCALGMAAAAVNHNILAKDAAQYSLVLTCWPWIRKALLIGAENKPSECMTCACCQSEAWLPRSTAQTFIMHIFDHHVCYDKTWTIERLAEWVASIEPQEEEVEKIAPPASIAEPVSGRDDASAREAFRARTTQREELKRTLLSS